MKQIIQVEGIVLKTADFKEQAVIATVLTKTETKNYIIRGAKKITSGTRLLSVPLTKIQFNATSTDGLDTITEGIVLNTYNEIKTDINKMMAAYAIIEKVLVFSKQVTEPNTFYTFVSNILDKIQSMNEEDALLAIFDLKLTYLIGIAPELKYCLNCGEKSEHQYFSIYHGGVRCDACGGATSHDLNEYETKSIQLLYYVKLDKVDAELLNIVKNDIPKISNVIDYYYQQHLDFTSKVKTVKKSIS